MLIPSRQVDLLTTTTKLSGYHEEDSWYAHPIVLDAIEVLRRIVRGYAAMVSLEPEKCPLLVSTVKIFMKNRYPNDRLEVTMFKPPSKSFLLHSDFTITKEDYDILQASDPERDFTQESKFQVGQQWPITTHQFRRSLAFYAVNSGFVSLPTLKRQYKHLTQEMTKYYSRNNENVKTVFGHYDTKSKQYVLPLSHIAYEVQIGMPIATAESLLKDLMDEDITLYGKSGSYFEKQRHKLREGDVLIEELIEDTARKVKNGEAAYRKTLLGGCTNTEVCSCAILGEFADCLTSKCAVIKSSNVDRLIESTKKEIKSYDFDSIEYHAAKAELDELVPVQKRNPLQPLSPQT